MSARIRLRTFLSFCLCLVFSPPSETGPAGIYEVSFIGYIESKTDNLSALVQLDGSFDRSQGWRASRNSEDCGGTKNVDYFDVRMITGSETNQDRFSYGTVTMQILLPADFWSADSNIVYLCKESSTFEFGGEVIKWSPVGRDLFVRLAPPDKNLVLNDIAKNRRSFRSRESSEYFGESEPLTRQLRELSENSGEPDLEYDSTENITEVETEIISSSRIFALTLPEVTKDVSYGDDGVINAKQGSEVRLDIYGFGLTNDSEVKLTSSVATVGHACKSRGLHVQTKSYPITLSADGEHATLVIPAGGLPAMKGKEILFLCLKTGRDGPFVHQGTAKALQIEVYDLLLPIWLMVIFLIILLCMSGLFSGLNLGLMALDQTELKIVQNTGSDKEKEYANKISPIRAHGNFLLCTLLLGNVLVNNTLTILLDTLTSGLVAVIGATIGIVIFGEIIPQAICSRHGLAVGAHTIFITKLFMIITFPLAFPISKILDKILGQEIGTVYNKKRLIELLRVTRDKADLEKEEVDIVTGALAYKEKTVRSVMTPIEDAYMLNIKTTLDFETISEIRDKGYSRIPVYDGDRTNISYVLFVKDLMFIDPDDNMPLSMVCEFYKNEVNFVFHDTPLNVMFNEFKSGDKGHMAFVQDVNTSGEGDPFYETVGLITLEDIIEEIIQQEIVDETDLYIDNRTKKRRMKNGKMSSEFPMFLEPRKVNVSPQLTLAVFQYLSTTIEPFKPKHISDVVLKKLLTMDVFREIKLKKNQTNEDELIIIEKGKPIDFFVLIVEGRVQANIGKEELVFESGPFSYYGLQVLSNVLDAPPSPMPVTTASAHSVVSNSGHEISSSNTFGGFRSATANLKKTNTQISFDVPHVLNRRASSITASALQASDAGQQGSLSRQGSAFFTYTFHPVIPDYTVKAATDVLYMCIKRNTFLRALKATVLSKKPSPGDELEKILDRVAEDDADVDHLLLSSPKLSPDKGVGFLERASSLLSGRMTPTLPLRGRSGSQGKQRTNPEKSQEKSDEQTKEEEEEFWNDHNNSRVTSNVTTPSPARPTSNGPVSQVTKQNTPERDRLSFNADLSFSSEHAVIKEEEETDHSISPPTSANALVISVRSTNDSVMTSSEGEKHPDTEPLTLVQYDSPENGHLS